MIKAFTAFTGDIDDADAAVSDIMRQLNGCGGLLSHSAGIITCYSDFVESGVVRELCRALPFDTVGATTLGSIVRGSDERIALSVMALTSDDAEFAVGLSGSMGDADEKALSRAYEIARAEMSGEAKLMISFMPLHIKASGDFYVDTLDKISCGVPNFGMMAVDNNLDYSEAAVIHRGEAYADRCAILLIGGGADPKFSIASIASQRVFRGKGVVTKSDGNRVLSVNNKPVAEYLMSFGLEKDADGKLKGVNAFPFIVDYNDGKQPVARVIFAMTPEGHAVCGGDIPEGATISVGHIDADGVLATTEDVLSGVMALSNEPGCVMMFSCVGRYFALNYREMAEIELVRDIMSQNSAPYLMAYSGGELCPVESANSAPGEFTNRNHNDTFIICTM